MYRILFTSSIFLRTKNSGVLTRLFPCNFNILLASRVYIAVAATTEIQCCFYIERSHQMQFEVRLYLFIDLLQSCCTCYLLSNIKPELA